LAEAAARESWGFVLDDPGPQDNVPVKLKPPRWASPIKAVFEGINILPAYHEADVSVVFMLFFSLFFAMLVGDVGYGLIFLVLTIAFWKKLPRNAAHLLTVTSLCTIAWGAMDGTVFGMSHHILAGTWFGKLQVPFIQDVKNLMGLCFLIGAVQITIGHVWNMVDFIKARKAKALEQFGWVLTTWFMFFVVDSLVLSGHMLGFLHLSDAQTALFWKTCSGTAIVSVLLIVLFMMKPSEFKEGWGNLVLLPLNLIGNFTDIISYVRLYAVGSAGFAVGNAFNNMIFGGEVTWWSGIIGAVLLFAAHAMNILLCLLGVLVHGIRLNTLEFSNHKGISWSGAPFRPFARPDVAA